MKPKLMLIIILIFGGFLRLDRLDELMSFIPDQGWFYLSARDMLLTGKIPLVGPETSHPWIHHGALWTYVLALILWLFNFNPIPPAYFIAILGVATVWLLYKISNQMFSKRIALIAAFFYATSPLIILNARMPYHTSPIPFFTILLFFAVYKWIKGCAYYFPLITFLFGVLYNHELTSFVLSIPIIIILVYGLFKKEVWVKKVLNKKIIFYSVLGFLIPMIPFILYDINHGFKQTFGFLVWVGYRLVKFSGETFSSINSLVEFYSYLQQLIFLPSLGISIFILSLGTDFLLFKIIRVILVSKERAHPESPIAIRDAGRASMTTSMDLGIILLFLFLLIPLVGLFLHRVPIEADVLLISPFIIMTIAVFFGKLMSYLKLKNVLILFLLFVSFMNVYFLFSTSYLTTNTIKNRLTISKQLRAVDSIIKMTGERNYNLVGKGKLSFFPVFTMPYEYLLWWKGHPPTKQDVNLKIVVWEKEGSIIVNEQEIKN